MGSVRFTGWAGPGVASGTRREYVPVASDETSLFHTVPEATPGPAVPNCWLSAAF